MQELRRTLGLFDTFALVISAVVGARLGTIALALPLSVQVVLAGLALIALGAVYIVIRNRSDRAARPEREAQRFASIPVPT